MAQKSIRMVRRNPKLAALLEGSEFNITSFGSDCHYDIEGDTDGRVLNINITASLKVS